MLRIIAGAFLALFTSLSFPSLALAQETLCGDEDFRPPHLVSPSISRGLVSPPPASIFLPFFDDFSKDQNLPDLALWDLLSPYTKVPKLSNQKGLHAPSKGVLTFDGADYYGVKYRTTLNAGEADVLQSKPIDLSAYSPSDSVMLSFFLQPGGLGDLPETQDSFIVWFGYVLDSTHVYTVFSDSLVYDTVKVDTFGYIQVAVDTFFDSTVIFVDSIVIDPCTQIPDTFPSTTVLTVIYDTIVQYITVLDSIYPLAGDSLVIDTIYINQIDSVVTDTIYTRKWVRAYARGGQLSAPGRFSPVVIPLLDSLFFEHPFMFKFTGNGSLNGELDLWHLDYVHLDANRSLGDTNYVDGTVVDLPLSLFGTYTAIPRKHFNADPNLISSNLPFVELANRDNISMNRSLGLKLSGPGLIGCDSLVGTLNLNGTITLAPNTWQDESLGFLTDQVINKDVTLELTACLGSMAGDNDLSNDTLKRYFRIDSLFAYDDGVADRPFGLNQPRGLAQRFSLPDPSRDTLTGVWINFSPLMYYNLTSQQSTCMDGQAFQLAIWTEVGGKPDTLFFSRLSGMTVNYGSELNQFIRYDLGSALKVPPVFYVGIIQSNEMPIGIGMDLNHDNSDKIFYQKLVNNTIAWVNTSFTGTLMIRPEFGTPPPLVGLYSPVKKPVVKTTLFPNPTQSDRFQIAFEGNEVLKKGDLRVFDLQGKLILSQKLAGNQRIYEITLPLGRGNGVYLVQLEGETQSARAVFSTQKLMVTGQ